MANQVKLKPKLSIRGRIIGIIIKTIGTHSNGQPNKKIIAITIKRIKYLLTNYNGTPSTEEGLLILIESYKYLKMNDLASDTARVLKENYPNYTIVNKNGVITAIKKKIKVAKEIEAPKDDGSSWFNFLNIYNYF